MPDNERIAISDATVEVVSYPRNEGEPSNRIGEICTLLSRSRTASVCCTATFTRASQTN